MATNYIARNSCHSMYRWLTTKSMVSFSRRVDGHIASLMRHEKSIVTYVVTFFLSKFDNQRAKWNKTYDQV